MSISKPRLVSPCSKTIEFKGDTGTFQYFEKSSESYIPIPLPFNFIFMDEMNGVGGFNQAHKQGIDSNEVHNLTTQKLSVGIYKSPYKIIGKYKDIKGEIAKIGGKFMKSVYAYLPETNEIVKLNLKGAAFSGWMEKKFNPELSPGIEVAECRQGKTGNVTYFIPIFKTVNVELEELEAAMNKDRELQDFLAEYENKEAVKEIEQEAGAGDDANVSDNDDVTDTNTEGTAETVKKDENAEIKEKMKFEMVKAKDVKDLNTIWIKHSDRIRLMPIEDQNELKDWKDQKKTKLMGGPAVEGKYVKDDDLPF